jgi:hypothetical protein
MAAGDVTQNARGWSVSLLVAATATNSPPSGASAGVALSVLDSYVGGVTKLDSGSLRIWSSAGSATMTVTCKLWGYDGATAKWYPAGIGGDTAKGIVNGGSAIGETASDSIVHSEPVYQISDFDRIYVEITAIGGTSTAINAALVVPRVPN